MARENQVASQVASIPAKDWGAPDVPDDFDHESASTVEVVNTHNTYTNIYDVCFNVEVVTGPTQLEEANMAYMTKTQAIQNLHYCVGDIASERLQHLVVVDVCLHVLIVRWPRPNDPVLQSLFLFLIKLENCSSLMSKARSR